MGELIRIAILAIGVWLVWRWLTQRPTLNHSANTATAAPPDRPMVRCALCALNLPATEAFHYREQYFCCQQHQADYLQQHQEPRP